MYPPKTVIEIARKAAGLSQAQLAIKAGTAQSSVSEYESRRKSPTLEVAERLLEAADAELSVKPIIDFDVRHDAEIGRYVVPEKLWSVPMPDCFSKIQVLGYLAPVVPAWPAPTSVRWSCRHRPRPPPRPAGRHRPRCPRRPPGPGRSASARAWDGVGEHTRFPIARLRFTKSTGQWAIYWRDRNLKFHEYKRKRPTKNVQAFLDHIEVSGDPIFWG